MLTRRQKFIHIPVLPETLLFLVLILACPPVIVQAQDKEHAPAGLHIQNPQLGKGVLLIAGKNLSDPNFSRTVVLITEFNQDGTVGLVINRRTKIPSLQFLPDFQKLVPLLDYIYIGGPVAAGYINLLVKADEPVSGAAEIIEGVYLINTLKIFNALPLNEMTSENLRLYSGLAGWAPGQLESELIRGDWHIWHASPEFVFSTTPEKTWEELIQIVSAKWVMLTSAGRDTYY